MGANPRLFSCKAVKWVPACYITKEYELWIALDAKINPDDMDFGPAELHGFGAGGYKEDDLRELKSNSKVDYSSKSYKALQGLTEPCKAPSCLIMPLSGRRQSSL